MRDPLNRLHRDLQLHGYAERTQEMYVRAVRQLVDYCKKTPDSITEDELRDYFLYIKNVKKYARSASTITICGIRFFYEHTLRRTWPTLSLVRAQKDKKLPVILTREEVRKIMANVSIFRHRACLTTIYSCGLRLQEGTNLQVADIDSARMKIYVRNGKGGKDRYVPLPKRSLHLLRMQWKTHRNPTWIFPGPDIHYIVLGGGLSEHGNQLMPTRYSEFLVRIEPLAKLFRGKFKAQMRKAGFLDEIPRQAWTKDWVVDIEPVGTADEALKYLAPYIYRLPTTGSRTWRMGRLRSTTKTAIRDNGIIPSFLQKGS